MIKKIVLTGASNFVSLLIAFLIGVILARHYGAEGKGLVALLLLVPNLIVSIVNFSVGEGFLYYLGKYQIAQKNFISLLVKISIFLLPLSFLLYIIFYEFISSYPYYFIPQLSMIFLLFFVEIYKFSLRAQMNFRLFNLIKLLEAIFILVTLIIIILFNINIINIIWGYVIYNFLSLIYMQKVINQNLKTAKVYKKVYCKDILSFSYKVHIFRIFNLVENKFDLLLIAKLLTLKDVGIYSVSISLIQIFQTIIQTSISTVLLPALVSNDNINKKTNITLIYFKISFILALLFGLFLIIIGKYFILIFFGKEFLSAYIPMVVLMVGALIKSPVACINTFFKSIGKPEELYKSSINSLIVNIILCIVLIPKFGIIGAAIASTLSYSLYGIQMIYKLKKESNISYSKLLINKRDFLNIKDILKKYINQDWRKKDEI